MLNRTIQNCRTGLQTSPRLEADSPGCRFGTCCNFYGE